MFSEHCGGITSVPSKQRVQAPLALTHEHNWHEKFPGILHVYALVLLCRSTNTSENLSGEEHMQTERHCGNSQFVF